MHDPYLYPGTEVLINNFDIKDADKLQDLETAFYSIKLSEPLPQGNFDYAHLKAIHQHLFGDVYPWAGQERMVDIIKGHSHFARSVFIQKELTKTFALLAAENYLKDVSSFTQRLAYYFNEINAAHPFREGNGRTLRAFCDLLAEIAGFHLAWEKLSPSHYLEANIAGFNGHYEGMEKLFNNITIPLTTSYANNIASIVNLDELEKLKTYVQKQCQFTQLLEKRNRYLGKDFAQIYPFNQEITEKSQELKVLAKEIAHNSSSLPHLPITSISKLGGFNAINLRFQNSQISIQDVQAIIRYAKASLTNNNQQSKGGRGNSK